MRMRHVADHDRKKVVCMSLVLMGQMSLIHGLGQKD